MSPKTRTKSSPSGLTSVEKKELERRGFLVKSNIDFRDFTLNFIYLISLFLPLYGFISVLFLVFINQYNFIPTYPIYFTITILIFLFLFSIKEYLISGTIFIAKQGVVGYGELYSNYATVLKRRHYSMIGEYLGSILFNSKFKGFFLALNFTQLTIIGLLSMVYIEYLLGSIIVFTCIFIVTFFLRILFIELFSINKFGNLGSKIQSLTPRITEESEKIEKEFSTDMNFRTLSDSFDTLAKDFSQISSYVIKLETIEQKANKGNLFDSEKYIGSLREDIVKPLTTLRSFLEKKKTELEASEQEMKKVRVRVGGSGHTGGNGEIENLELQSKRSEPLRAELTENIDKLDIMIEKFGKI